MTHDDSQAPSDVSAIIDAWLADSDAGIEEAVAPAAESPATDGPAVEGDVVDPATGSLLQALALLEEHESNRPAPSAVAARTAAPQDHLRYVLFTVAGAHYAVRQPFVTELDRVPRITHVPNVPAWVAGVANRRGDILSVVDMRTLLGIERLAAGGGRLLVVRLLDDSCGLGLLVDDVQQIVSVPGEDIRQAGAGIDGTLAPFLSGLFDAGERTVAILDLDGLLRSPVIRQFDEPTDAAADDR